MWIVTGSPTPGRHASERMSASKSAEDQVLAVAVGAPASLTRAGFPRLAYRVLLWVIFPPAHRGPRDRHRTSVPTMDSYPAVSGSSGRRPFRHKTVKIPKRGPCMPRVLRVRDAPLSNVARGSAGCMPSNAPLPGDAVRCEDTGLGSFTPPGAGRQVDHGTPSRDDGIRAIPPACQGASVGAGDPGVRTGTGPPPAAGTRRGPCAGGDPVCRIEPGRAGADDQHVAAPERLGVAVDGRVHQCAAELVATRPVRRPRPVEDPGRHHDVVRTSIIPAGGDPPATAVRGATSAAPMTAKSTPRASESPGDISAPVAVRSA
jgi:hypothetical protein